MRPRRFGPRIMRMDIADAMESALSGLQSGSQLRESMAIGIWDTVVGPQAAAATQPESVRDGVLFVRTKSSVWSHELTFLKGHIIAELNRRLGGPAIHEIIFRARGVPPRKPQGTDGSSPSEEELAAISLSADEAASIQRELRAVAPNVDDALRHRLARRLERERKLQRWRMEHGWRPCTRCGVPHNQPESLCPICRLS